eukprot:scaffold209152_cov26-Tisochrysis_lutea.AAC.1
MPSQDIVSHMDPRVGLPCTGATFCQDDSVEPQRCAAQGAHLIRIDASKFKGCTFSPRSVARTHACPAIIRGHVSHHEQSEAESVSIQRGVSAPLSLRGSSNLEHVLDSNLERRQQQRALHVLARCLLAGVELSSWHLDQTHRAGSPTLLSACLLATWFLLLFLH